MNFCRIGDHPTNIIKLIIDGEGNLFYNGKMIPKYETVTYIETAPSIQYFSKEIVEKASKGAIFLVKKMFESWVLINKYIFIEDNEAGLKYVNLEGDINIFILG